MSYAQRMKRTIALARTYWLELAAIIAAANAALEVALRRDAANAPELSPWLGAPVLVLLVLPLLARRRWPFAAGTGLWLFAAALSFVDGRLVSFSASVFVAGMAASFLLGNLKDARQARVGLLVVLGGAAIIVHNDPAASAADFVFLPALFAFLWLAGMAVRLGGARADAAELQAARLARDREEAMRFAIADERTRIARELHDVLGHSVSAMTIQASAVRRRLAPEQQEEHEALLSVERTGREALAEMRRLVGLLRMDDGQVDLEPQPGLARLPQLIEQARGLGQTVAFNVEGNPVTLPPGVDLAAYRVVQEGLTNARKHSKAPSAEVRLRYRDTCIEVEVRDYGTGDNAPGVGGLGLVGLKERVSIFGGELEAGPRPEGGYLLRARLPVPS